jgi:hypothetical protein
MARTTADEDSMFTMQRRNVLQSRAGLLVRGFSSYIAGSRSEQTRLSLSPVFN